MNFILCHMFKYHVEWIKLDFYLLIRKITHDSLLISITCLLPM